MAWVVSSGELVYIEGPAKVTDGVIDTQDNESWLRIPDNGWDRAALELWVKGYPVKEIASQVSASEGRVRNRITELRNAHGEEIVPYRRRSLKM